MSLEAALYEMTGAGLVACAAGLGIAVPPGAVRNGDAFVGFLSQRGAWGEINRLVEELKRDIQHDAAAAMASEADVVRQVAEAIVCLEDVRPETDLLRAALTPSSAPLGAPHAAPAGAVVAGDAGPIVPAARIAGQMIARAAAAHPPHLHVATPATPSAGPSLGAQQVLHRLFTHLLRDPFLVVGLGPALQDYLAMTTPVAVRPPAPAPRAAPQPELTLPSRVEPVAAAPSPGTAAQEFGGNVTATFSTPPLAHPSAIPSVPPAGPQAPAVTALVARVGIGETYAAGLVAAGVLDTLDSIQRARGVSAGAFARFLRTLESQVCPPRTAPLRLDEMAASLESLIATLTKPSNEDADTRRLKAEAARALADGDLEGAVQSLKSVRRTIREGRRRIEERLREDIMLLNEQMAGEAGVIARQAEMELTRRDYAAAAELFAEARDSLPRSEVQSAWLYAMRQGEALFRLGDEFDDARALSESARAYAACLTMVGKDEAPRNWVAAQCGIALAHLRLAERSTDTAALTGAIEAWRAALGVLDKLGPAEAGQLHVSRRHLAQALVLLGEREGETAALGEAAALYRTMVAALPRDRNPHDWAEAHMGLASTLLLLDERGDGADAGGAGLAEASAALDVALAVYTRAQTPSEWATARMNKGNALLALGERAHNLAHYGEAVLCFEDALTVQSRQTAPGNWALLKTNIANAHAAIGEQARDPARLELAATAYRQALEVLHGPGESMRRAIAELNLGTVLVRLASTSDPQGHWLEAMAVMLSALETFKAKQATAFIRIAEVNLRSLHAVSRGALQAKAS